MVVIEDYQFTLGGVTFGHGTDYPVGKVDGIGLSAKRARTYDLAGEDGITFGREYRGAKELVFEAAVRKPGAAALAFDALEVLQEAWDGDPVRLSARDVEPLTIKRPGAPARRLYGRPDRFDPDIALSVVGWIPWQSSFVVSDPGFYADAEDVLTLSLSPVSNGGLVSDPQVGGLVSPLTSTGVSVWPGTVENRGTLPTAPVVEFVGPVLNPECVLLDEFGGVAWSLRLATELAYDQRATIDTRPWARTVLRSDGASLAGALTRESRPSRSTLPRGTSQVVFKGQAVNGSPSMTIRWRSRYRSL